MAKTLQNVILTLVIIFITLFLFLSFTSAYDYTFSKNLYPKNIPGFKHEKLTHLHFYFHAVVSGPNPTVVKVAEAPMTNSSSVSFGFVGVRDDFLTVGPEPTSKRVGRAQGMGVSASQSELGLLLVLNNVFTQGKYKGSTLSILGHNPIFSAVREMPIIGGSGFFRFAKGYAQARTYMLNTTSRDAIVEYNVYVFHY